MSDDLAQQLLILLREERAAIRDAAFERLDELASDKASLFEALVTNGVQEPDLKKIRNVLAENQTLLAAAIAGVDAARKRLAALESVRDELSVYDKSGRIAKVARPSQALEKKA